MIAPYQPHQFDGKNGKNSGGNCREFFGSNNLPPFLPKSEPESAEWRHEAPVFLPEKICGGGSKSKE